MSENEKGPEMNPEDLKILINENEIIKVVLRVMNDLNAMIGEDEIEPDYMELWNNVALTKKTEISNLTGNTLDLYYQLLTCGYDNFGVEFFKHLSTQVNYPYLCYGITSLIKTIELSTETIKAQQETIENLSEELKKLKDNA